jgi:hypothetical protein
MHDDLEMLLYILKSACILNLSFESLVYTFNTNHFVRFGLIVYTIKTKAK